MKNTLFPCLCCLFFLSLTACKKEKMQSKRLLGNWTTTEYIANNDSLSLDLLNVEEATGSFRYRFTEDSFAIDYILTYTGTDPFILPFRGTWRILNDELRLRYAGEFCFSAYLTGENSREEIWQIIKLSKGKLLLAGENAAIYSNIKGEKE